MKPYVKPELFLEEFELSQSVAACGWDMTNDMDKNNCYATGDPDFDHSADEIIFTVAPCNIFEEESYCYEVPTANDAFRIFRS